MNWPAFLGTYATAVGAIAVLGAMIASVERTRPSYMYKLLAVLLATAVIAGCFAAGLGIKP